MSNFFDINSIVTTYGYLGIIVIVFLESGIFFPLPGDSLIFAAGLLAPDMGFNIVTLTIVIFLAAFFGGIAGYYLGTKIEYFHKYAFFRKFIKQEHLDKAHVFLEHHGLSSMLLCRFIPIVRTFLPIVAGVVNMNYGEFVRYSMLGSLLWTTVFVLGGYYLGKSFPQLEENLLAIVIVVVVISILPAIIHFVRARKLG